MTWNIQFLFYTTLLSSTNVLANYFPLLFPLKLLVEHDYDFKIKAVKECHLQTVKYGAEFTPKMHQMQLYNLFEAINFRSLLPTHFIQPTTTECFNRADMWSYFMLVN